MKRSALLTLTLALVGAGSAEAQLTMQMGNGWSFTFAGNVNTFLTYENADADGQVINPAALVGAGFKETRIRTGLLPAFAVFDAKGKEGNTDLGVHFGFAPQVNCADAVNDCFGAQIDMRQVYLTVGGGWGQFLVGREIGLWNRQNILNDQTLFGVGGTGSTGETGVSGVGTTLGRIGFGYVYPNFRAQITYSTPAGRPTSFSIGLFEATAVGDYTENELPRVEAEFSYTGASGFGAWVNGVAQRTKNLADESAAVFGGGGGLKFASAGFSIVGSGYFGRGVGTTLFGNLGSADTGVGSDDLRDGYGFIGQLAYNPAGSKMTIAGSYGSSFLKSADVEAVDVTFENNLISGGLYYQATKSLKLVGEFNYAQSKDDVDATENNKSIVPAVGFMLFF